MNAWGPTHAVDGERGKAAWSRHRKWLRFSRLNRMFATLHLGVGRGPLLGVTDCTNGKQVAQVAPGSPLKPRADVTDESQHPLQLHLNLASESFYSMLPAAITTSKCWHSTGNLPAIPSLAKGPVAPVATCVIAALLVQEFKHSCLYFPVTRRHPTSGVLPRKWSQALSAKRGKRGPLPTTNKNAMFASPSVLQLTVCSFSFCFLSIKK